MMRSTPSETATAADRVEAGLATVWVAESGMIHDGGSADGVFSTFDRAMAWLRDQHAEALVNAAEMDRHRQETGFRAGEPWTVTDIEVKDGNRAAFEDPIRYWEIRPFPIDAPTRTASLPSEGDASVEAGGDR